MTEEEENQGPHPSRPNAELHKKTAQKRLQFRKKHTVGERISGGLSNFSHLFTWPIWPWKKARIYNDLGSMLRSGVSLVEAIHTMAEARKGNVGKLFRGLQESVEQGQGLGVAMAMQPERISPGDAALIEASELTGNLPEALEKLAKFNQFQVELLKKNLFMIIYPVVLYILGLFLLNLPILVSGKIHLFVMTVVMGLLFLIIPVVLGLFAVSFVPLRRVVPWIKRIAWHIPMVSIPLKHLGIGMYAKGMTTGLGAGFGIDRTLDVAEKLSNIPGIARINQGIKGKVSQGENLFIALRSTRMFSVGELSSIKAGEKSGTLDAVFESISNERMSRFSMTAKILMYAILLPFFIAMLGTVAYQVFNGLKQATIGNLNQIQQEINSQGVIKYIK